MNKAKGKKSKESKEFNYKFKFKLNRSSVQQEAEEFTCRPSDTFSEVLGEGRYEVKGSKGKEMVELDITVKKTTDKKIKKSMHLVCLLALYDALSQVNKVKVPAFEIDPDSLFQAISNFVFGNYFKKLAGSKIEYEDILPLFQNLNSQIGRSHQKKAVFVYPFLQFIVFMIEHNNDDEDDWEDAEDEVQDLEEIFDIFEKVGQKAKNDNPSLAEFLTLNSYQKKFKFLFKRSLKYQLEQSLSIGVRLPSSVKNYFKTEIQKIEIEPENLFVDNSEIFEIVKQLGTKENCLQSLVKEKVKQIIQKLEKQNFRVKSLKKMKKWPGLTRDDIQIKIQELCRIYNPDPRYESLKITGFFWEMLEQVNNLESLRKAFARVINNKELRSLIDFSPVIQTWRSLYNNPNRPKTFSWSKKAIDQLEAKMGKILIQLDKMINRQKNGQIDYRCLGVFLLRELFQNPKYQNLSEIGIEEMLTTINESSNAPIHDRKKLSLPIAKSLAEKFIIAMKGWIKNLSISITPSLFELIQPFLITVGSLEAILNGLELGGDLKKAIDDTIFNAYFSVNGGKLFNFIKKAEEKGFGIEILKR